MRLAQNISLNHLILKASLVLTTGALLTACQATTTSDLQLEGSADQGSSETRQTQTTDSSQTTQPNQVLNQEEPMKQLSDFEPIEASQVTLTTSKGDITITLYREQTPITTLNFLNLAKDGFYDGMVFHRVIPDFMAQVGDPLTKDPSKEAMWGSGGPGYVIPDEFNDELKHDSPGIVSMANRGPSTGGSQIFLTFEPTPWLDGKHTVFGKVTEGLDILMQIEQGDTITSVSYQ